MTKKESNDEQQTDGISDQEQMAQIALGNIQEIQPSTDNNNELLTTPKTSGTGSNPSAAAPHSLIVNKNADGEESGTGGREEPK